ncbi:fumarate reductase subunit D [Clostridium tetanomorphum]|uniref:hypothetical protein n=1 Tax=Clostridium tetanomorphum TaxID=1553 RepID=UPI000449B29D|nr:hypothetical protein [Clostridium tetanomorphum]KAJ49637.1 hypothetical protein CTM_22128 [Clostridium tetanomorphum DSM 665]KAJ52429.1 hypothetical protein CTM_08021 [Clostridium tetanomorphum DSM 665]MBP1864734.1 fumarate reductase subunit D [Clostridium tetanomorphum]NRS83911.1 fumarate reductase subunit D [Clostridium tetanomorphum]SQB93136.1 Uncharacterised protein [Clostridium tetanomorphum]
MKVISLITGIVTILLLLSTLICGLWIKSHDLVNNIDSLAFHMRIGIASVIFGLFSTILLIIQVIKH